MAMTNVQIIETEKMLRGIKEEIHTFERWKALGYSVKKGAKSEIKFAIWKYTDGKKKDKETGEETEGKAHCFMKMSAFFTESQVEPLKEKAVKAGA